MIWRCRLLCRQLVRTILNSSTFFSTLPVTSKEVTKCQNSDYQVAACSMQGWRGTMEDAYSYLLEPPEDPTVAFFAVFDGHGGADVSTFLANHLHAQILSSWKQILVQNDIPAAIKYGFLQLDENLKLDVNINEQVSGSTALVLMIKNQQLFCGNAGDSRAVLCRDAEAIPLSFDHKPTNLEERQRIEAAGGWVQARRVNGVLALSRALGDHIFKSNYNLSAEHQAVTALPDIVTAKLDKEHDEFILLACDGVWDILSNEEAVCFCRQRLAEGFAPEQVCQQLVDHCLAPCYTMTGAGCDNMTVVLVCLLHGRSVGEYVERLGRNSSNVYKNVSVVKDCFTQ